MDIFHSNVYMCIKILHICISCTIVNSRLKLRVCVRPTAQKVQGLWSAFCAASVQQVNCGQISSIPVAHSDLQAEHHAEELLVVYGDHAVHVRVELPER